MQMSGCMCVLCVKSHFLFLVRNLNVKYSWNKQWTITFTSYNTYVLIAYNLLISSFEWAKTMIKLIKTLVSILKMIWNEKKNEKLHLNEPIYLWTLLLWDSKQWYKKLPDLDKNKKKKKKYCLGLCKWFWIMVSMCILIWMNGGDLSRLDLKQYNLWVSISFSL